MVGIRVIKRLVPPSQLGLNSTPEKGRFALQTNSRLLRKFHALL